MARISNRSFIEIYVRIFASAQIAHTHSLYFIENRISATSSVRVVVDSIRARLRWYI